MWKIYRDDNFACFKHFLLDKVGGYFSNSILKVVIGKINISKRILF